MPMRAPPASPLPLGRCWPLPPATLACAAVPLLPAPGPAVRPGRARPPLHSDRPPAAGSASASSQCRVSARSHSSVRRLLVVCSSPGRLLVIYTLPRRLLVDSTAASFAANRLVPASPCHLTREVPENLEILDVLGEAWLVKRPPGCVCLSRITACPIIPTRCVAPARGACTWPWPCWWRSRASRCAWPRRSETLGTRGPARRAAPPTAAAACPTRSSSCATASTTRTSRPTRRPLQRSTGRRPCSCRSATA